MDWLTRRIFALGIVFLVVIFVSAFTHSDFNEFTLSLFITLTMAVAIIVIDKIFKLNIIKDEEA